MKFIFLSGGLLGFCVAGLSGWTAERSPDRILLDAMLGALVGGLLLRWLWSVALRGMREVHRANHPPTPPPEGGPPLKP